MVEQTADSHIAETEDELIFREALAGAPDFYDIPEDMQSQLEEAVEGRERFFWLQATRIPQNTVTRSLLRRAMYAECRVMDSESRLGEMGLICRSAKDRIDELEKRLGDLAGAVGPDVQELIS